MPCKPKRPSRRRFDDGKAVGSKSILHILLSGIDDAGGDKDAVLCKIFADILAQTDDDIRHDVGADQLEAALHLAGQIALVEGDAVGNLVERSIFARYLDCNLVDVTAFDLLCTQQRRCDGKDTASAANI